MDNENTENNALYNPLSQAAPGARVRVVKISRDIHCRQRLLGMGIAPGVEITVERIASSGAMVLEIDGKKFLLGEGLPSQVTVNNKSGL